MRRSGWAIAWVAVAALAAFAYGWAIDGAVLETYYAGADRAMAGSWPAFVFGAADPAATVTMDKLPGSFWLQALSVRAFGPTAWAVVLPQVVEGVLAVLVLGRAVARLAGPGPALAAGALLAVSPAAVALARGNVSDSLMILFAVLAADAASAAIRRGGTGPVLLAGLWVGCAFEAKMLAGWLVLPALGLAVLVAAPGSVAGRLGRLVAGGTVAVVVSLAWIAAVGLVPPADRPVVDGSASGSLWEMVFVYNGFGRVGSAGPLAELAAIAPGLVPTIAPPSPVRLFTGSPGLMTGWWLLTALAALVAVLLARRGTPRTDPVRAAAVLWGTWLVTFGVAFSAVGGLREYYTAALAPAVAALLALGGAVAWERRTSRVVRLVTAAVAAGTAAYAIGVVATLGDAAPSWLVPMLAVAAVAGLVLAWFRAALPGAAAAAALAVVLAPAVGSAQLVADGLGPFDLPFPGEEELQLRASIVAHDAVLVSDQVPALEERRGGAAWLAAYQPGNAAGPLIWASGEEVLPIGGFTGAQPHPTVDELAADVARGLVGAVAVTAPHDPRTAWVATHCRPDAVRNGVGLYRCGPA